MLAWCADVAHGASRCASDDLDAKHLTASDAELHGTHAARVRGDAATEARRALAGSTGHTSPRLAHAARRAARARRLVRTTAMLVLGVDLEHLWLTALEVDDDPAVAAG